MRSTCWLAHLYLRDMPCVGERAPSKGEGLDQWPLQLSVLHIWLFTLVSSFHMVKIDCNRSCTEAPSAGAQSSLATAPPRNLARCTTKVLALGA